MQIGFDTERMQITWIRLRQSVVLALLSQVFGENIEIEMQEDYVEQHVYLKPRGMFDMSVIGFFSHVFAQLKERGLEQAVEIYPTGQQFQSISANEKEFLMMLAQNGEPGIMRLLSPEE